MDVSTKHTYLSILECDFTDEWNTFINNPGECAVEAGEVSPIHLIWLLEWVNGSLGVPELEGTQQCNLLLPLEIKFGIVFA